jgi:predicted TIM-barrel fold metal-dependent hydrolase
MSLLGIETAIVSITAPGTKIYENNKEKGRILARKLNEFSFDLVKNNPKQFGFFASLPPLIDIEGTINEIDYVHSILKPDGFTLFTSYGHGQYLGHPSFKPIWEKLNQLKTVVFIHPSEAPTTIVNQYLPQPLIDYPQETTRAASDIVLSGTRATFPDVKIILSHAGGTLPFLARRISMAGLMPSLHCPRDAKQILSDFRSFYFDIALSSSTIQLQALMEFADPSKILFGSDVPYAPLPAALDFTKNLDAFFFKNKNDQDEQLWQAINRENAKLLFPNKVKD